MSTYAEKLKPHIQFKNKEQMDEQVTKYRQTIGYKLNDTDNKILNYMKAYAVRYTGVFYQLIETMSDKVGKSPATIKRTLKKITELGIVKRIPTRKENGRRKGATIYQFQFFKPQSEPKRMSLRESKNGPSNPFESKAEQIATKSKPFIFSNKSFKDTNTTEVAQMKLLKEGLLSKLPDVIANSISPFFDDLTDLYNMAGTIFRAKSKVDKSIKLEDYSTEYRKSILSVINSWKRAMRNNKDMNVFAVMYKAISETTAAIVDGTINQPKGIQKSTGYIEVKPSWFDTRNEKKQESAITEENFEQKHIELMKKLYGEDWTNS